MRSPAFTDVTEHRHLVETSIGYAGRMLDPALALAGALFSAHLLSLALAWRKCRPQGGHRPANASVSLVRPVCGLDFDLERTLRSSFTQDYPDLEVLFCAARADDPAVAVVARLLEEHSSIRARLLVGETRLSQNPKLNNMEKGWASATGDLVIFADSNLLLPPDYCGRVAAAFAESGAVVVSSPPVGDRPDSFFGEVECAMLNTHAARWQFAASALGIDFAQGKTLAFQRAAFNDDLMRELGGEPAEDAAATKIVRNMGATLHVLAPPFVHPVGDRTPGSFWSRHVRWARLRRVTFPGVFALEAACGILPPLLALALSQAIDRDVLPLVLACAVASWYGAEYALARSLGWRATAWFLPACLVRDAMLPAFYVAAWVSARFEWRGHTVNSAIKQTAA